MHHLLAQLVRTFPCRLMDKRPLRPPAFLPATSWASACRQEFSRGKPGLALLGDKPLAPSLSLPYCPAPALSGRRQPLPSNPTFLSGQAEAASVFPVCHLPFRSCVDYGGPGAWGRGQARSPTPALSAPAGKPATLPGSGAAPLRPAGYLPPYPPPTPI